MKRWFWSLDALTVISFVVIGRDSHGFVTDWGATMLVALPFLIALGVGIVATRAWTNPTSPLVGLGIAAVTVVLGLMLRHFAFDDGTAATFMWLTAGWMTAWMVGWRLVFNLVAHVIGLRGVGDVEPGTVDARGQSTSIG